ncbi:pilus assembly protein PilZ [Ornithinibacillus sp. L9]|uniref:Pilus assembly protein PilZ n=1 Tax=Ornithinibacillus caprae TaxID=2678566 RepID=A0A6N8FCH9_9BACI|nr:flagellar brake domain-containing protein [Ornithinibacillus caprae]MUK87253.1 pilus assembly protein PilZ [Ornithinibacillus caprae]
MKIGTILRLEENNKEKFRCKIIEKNERHLIIDYPINIKSKKTRVFKKDTILTASYVDEDNAVYRFKTVVKGKHKLNVPALSLQIPGQDEIERIQRREYVRIDTAVDLAVHSKNNTFAPFTTVSSDISGGGLSFIIPRGVNLEETETVTLLIVLHMNSGEYQYIGVEGEIVRVINNPNAANIASLKYTSITKPSQQHIIRYCFEVQREQRQKELQ